LGLIIQASGREIREVLLKFSSKDNPILKYLDHLPVLGRPPTVSIVAESASQVVTATPSCKHEDNLRFCVGEKVVVNVSSEVLKQIQVFLNFFFFY